MKDGLGNPIKTIVFKNIIPTVDKAVAPFSKMLDDAIEIRNMQNARVAGIDEKINALIVEKEKIQFEIKRSDKAIDAMTRAMPVLDMND